METLKQVVEVIMELYIMEPLISAQLQNLMVNKELDIVLFLYKLI